MSLLHLLLVLVLDISVLTARNIAPGKIVRRNKINRINKILSNQDAGNGGSEQPDKPSVPLHQEMIKIVV